MNFESFQQAELNLMSHLKGIKGPILDQFMILLNHLDTMPFYYLVIVVAWFAYKRKLGLELLIVFIVTVIINFDLKIIFSRPRPFLLDPSLGLIKVSYFSFPSGAAQTSATFFGIIALETRHKWIFIFGAFYCLLIGFSRVYLGVHYPSDILGGWVIAALVVTAFYFLKTPLQNFLSTLSNTKKLAFIGFCALFLALCSISPDALLKMFGGLGACIGLLYAPYLQDPHLVQQRIIRPAVALLGIFILETLLGLTLNSISNGQAHFWISAFYLFLIGLWISYGMACLFKKSTSSGLKL